MTYREVELDEARALNEVLYDFTRERLAVRVKLARLDRDQTCKLLEAILAEEVPQEFLDHIYRETEGNPFFIEEGMQGVDRTGQAVPHGCVLVLVLYGRHQNPAKRQGGHPDAARQAPCAGP